MSRNARQNKHQSEAHLKRSTKEHLAKKDLYKKENKIRTKVMRSRRVDKQNREIIINAQFDEDLKSQNSKSSDFKLIEIVEFGYWDTENDSWNVRRELYDENIHGHCGGSGIGRFEKFVENSMTCVYEKHCGCNARQGCYNNRCSFKSKNLNELND